MSNYDEEHGISRENSEGASNGNTDRREMRTQFLELFQEFTHNVNQEESDNGMLLLLLSQMIPASLQQEWMEQMEQPNKGCSESFINSIPRVSTSKIKKDDSCPICCCTFRDDDHPLVAELPHCGHRFDLECISVWLYKSTSCPLCRDDVMSHKSKVDTSQVELEEDWGMFG